MADPFHFDLMQQVPQIKPHIHHAAKQVAAAAPVVKQGISMLNTVIAVAVATVVSGVVGYFVGKRGLTGTKSDLTNAKNEVEKVVSAANTAATSPTPVA